LITLNNKTFHLKRRAAFWGILPPMSIRVPRHYYCSIWTSSQLSQG